ncbi:MAG: alpha/beta fold hydrolase [Candidatus Binatia bacterium]
MIDLHPPPPAEGFVGGDGRRLHYLEWGAADAPPVVLLHGGSAHAHWWDFVAPPLADTYRCIAPDLRGHGESDWPADREYRLVAHAADVARLTDALALPAVAVIGHSFGGFVAMEYARTAGARLAALAIVDSRVRIGERSARYMDALRKLPHPVYASPAEALARFRLLPSGTTAPAAVLAHVLHHGIVERDDGTWTFRFDRRAMASTPMQDFSPILAALTCPILAVRAGLSPIVSASALAEYAGANPRTELAEIADAHHHVMLDQPAALAALLRRFLATALGR